MFIPIFTLSFVTYVNAAIGNFECLQDNSGASKGADWWIQYKLADGLDSFVISDTVAQWAAVAVNAATSPTVYTFNQYLAAKAADKIEAAVLAYNNHPPFIRRSLKSSSSKGFIAWGAEAGKAIWVIHTMDKFVNLELVDSTTLFNYAPLQDKAGMLMCLTFSYNLNEWAEALLYEDAVIYFWQMPKTPGATQTAFAAPAIQKLLSKEAPRSHFSKYTKTMTTASQTAPVKIHTISKFGNNFSLDMYISLILKILYKPIRVWTGEGTNIQPSFCKPPLLIENVVGPINIGDKEINFRQDTARWSIVNDTLNLFCLSTVGREKEKVDIPSGVVCIEQPTVHSLFTTLAADSITKICKR
ncbi:Plancitoxin-1 [Trichinella pseudospiralis]|uniref:Plancitoxin-1 n=1 Tax=Trichinella pseudospiralis TaxID=6337 RepID=A0A0V1F7S5_TRIPS|nr:Plancitoxin-1 [Trichinella pseudospiralis]